MPRGNHAASGRALPWVIVALLALGAAGGTAFALLRGGGDGAPGEEEIPTFAFDVTEVTPVAVVQGARGDTRAATRAIKGTLDRLYTVGFVDPREWGGGFPALGQLFSGPAATRAAKDLDDLTLGSSAADIERVEPRPGKLTVSYLVDAESAPISAVAVTEFLGRGRTSDGGRLDVSHAGRFLLEPVGESWLIVGYEVRGTIDTQEEAT